MAEIRSLLLWSHLRSEASRHVLQYRRGETVRSGRGLAFWFAPWSSSIAEVPIDDQELTLLMRGRSADFQELTVQGVLQWRVRDPEALASRLDFTLDLSTGRHAAQPLEQVANLLTEKAQQITGDTLAEASLAEVLEHGVGRLRARIHKALAESGALAILGVELVSVAVRSIRPIAEVERALQVTTRERIQQDADKATFERRALAVERERAIAENELQNKIELAKRTETLIAQEAKNARRRVTEHAENERLQALAAAERKRVETEAEAEAIRALEEARNATEEANVAIYRDLAPEVLLGLAAREMAGQLPSIGQLTVTPDLVSRALARLDG